MTPLIPSPGEPIVRTVCGDRPASQIANVLVHEHILFDIAPPGAQDANDAPITMQTRWQTDYMSNRNPSNARQQDRQTAADELSALNAEGGDLIVDQSTHGLARDPQGLREASRASGCSVVAAAGTYTAPYLDAVTLEADVETLAQRFTDEITLGLDGSDIRAGLIGEIGCSWPMEPVEKRALQAAARASRATGAGISVHPGRDPAAPFDIVDILESEGADLSRCVICHMDRTYPDGNGPLELAKTGVMVEWDFFGIETSHYWMGDAELPTDRGRLRVIAQLFEAGLQASVLVSQDICTRTRLLTWGGHGYGHILRNVRPLMASMGFSTADIDRILRINPLSLLAMTPETTA
jgi:phosphotriesterase-related protein